MSLVAILSFAGAKVLHFFEPTKYFPNFFQNFHNSVFTVLNPEAGSSPVL